MHSSSALPAQRKTVCSYPRILWLIRVLFQGGFRLAGWTFSTQPPAERKYVMVVAPHTSNWDFFLMVGLGAALGRQARFMVKDSVFVGPLGSLMRWLGGISVDRGSQNNVVQQMTETFAGTDDMVLIIAPEGTRKAVPRWKGGFYHIAVGAQVPVVPVFLDYGRKQVGFGEPCLPSGDLDADMPVIQQCYADVTACHPEGDSSHPAKLSLSAADVGN
ncbi:lysophospholipid acyltransferase family protein [Spongiibacter tropicus]|uniref:lysophospholipid acyltransferase family protein n=1 Tax=Spongiibacter tropicus TaxID=454602 RepID=UPI002353EF5D|nr:lysophospholipid acyltransferase family protein [Spongiibacter tropicus]